MRQNQWIKRTSFVLILSMFITILTPYQLILAEENKPWEGIEANKLTKGSVIDDKFPDLPQGSENRIEIKGKRKENKKEFLNSDGSITTEVFSRPVHWKNKKGKYKNIENKLVKQQLKFENKSNKWKTKFPEEYNDKSIHQLTYNDYQVDFIPMEARKIKGTIRDNRMLYKNVYQHVDFEYITLSNAVKENIILKNSGAQSSFTFEITTGQLIPELASDNTISFKDDDGEVIFKTAAPYAYDGKEERGNVETTLYQENGSYFLEISVDDAWYNSENREFPVVIDPTTTFEPVEDYNSMDTEVRAGSPDSSNEWRGYIAAGDYQELSSVGKRRSYLWFNLPEIESGSEIKNAELVLSQQSSPNSTVLDVHQVTQDWDDASLTWNTQPQTSQSILDTLEATDTSANVTSLAKEWYKGVEANYGLMLKANPESSDRRVFHSSENGDPTLNPKLKITYEVDPKGLEKFWSYDGNVNMHNGNLFLSNADVHLPGKGAPITVIRSYNSRADARGNNSLSEGWTLSTNASLQFKDPYHSKVIVLNDADGTNHIFTEPDGEDGMWKSPAGIDLELKYEPGNPNYFVVTTKNGSKHYFDETKGDLQKIVDKNGNETAYAYNSEGKVDYITDSSGRTVDFVYFNSGKLWKITGAEIPTVEYIYDTDERLIQVKKKDDVGNTLQSVSYSYFDSNLNNDDKIMSITDHKGSSTSIAYDTTTAEPKVSEVKKDANVSDQIKTLKKQYEFSDIEENNKGFQLIKTDPKGNQSTYKTNGVGNVTFYQKDPDDDSTNDNLIQYKYTWDSNNYLREVQEGKQEEQLRKTLIKYDEKGNVTQVENPIGDHQEYKYDEDDNLEEFTDFNDETTSHSYDEKQNNNATVSPLAGVSFKEFYDNGNKKTGTSPISLGDNLIVNSGFELWDSNQVRNWTNGGSGSVIKSPLNVDGNYSLKLVSPSPTDTAEVKSQYLPVKNNTKYNISWQVKTEDVQNKANVSVEWYDQESSTTPLSVSKNLANEKGTHNWSRKGSRVNVPFNANFARVVVHADTGTAYFDNVQMEKGTFINDYNIVANPGIEGGTDGDGTPKLWGIYSAENTGSDGVDDTVAKSGNSSIVLNGESMKNKYLGQNLGVSGEEGSVISFSAWSKSSGIEEYNGDYVVMIKLNYKNQSTNKWKAASFTKTNHDWEYEERTVTAEDDFESIDVYVKFVNSSGEVWFDDIKVQNSTVANAKMSQYNIIQNGSFEYDLDDSEKADDWNQLTEDKTLANFNWINTEDYPEKNYSYTGKHSVSLKNPEGWAVYSNLQYEPVEDGETYSASAFVKAENVTSGAGYLKLDLYNQDNNYIDTVKSKPITGSTDWQRVFVEVNGSELKQNISPDISYLKVSAGTISSMTGSLYFDSIRLESRSVTTSYDYDSEGNYLTSLTDPVGNETTMNNDERGNVTAVELPNGESASYNYDSLDRLDDAVTITDLGIDYEYDGNGNIENVIYKDNNTGEYLGNIHQTFNELNQVKKVTDQLGEDTKFSYDLNGNLVNVEAPQDRVTTFGYDNANRLTSRSYGTTEFKYLYDEFGNVTEVQKNKSPHFDYIYDDLNRVTYLSYPQNSGVRNTVDYSYSPIGSVTNIDHSIISGTTEYNYDDAGLLSSLVGPNGVRVYQFHNEAGQVKKANVGDGNYNYNVYRSYNDNGQIIRLRKVTNDGEVYADVHYKYDSLGNRTQIVHKDGSKIVYQYDKERLIQETHYNADSSIQKDITYAYDVIGNRTSVTKDGETINYDYNEANQIKNVGTTPYTYDVYGNLIDDQELKYEYNDNDRLVRVTDQSDNEIARYEYYENGRRSKKVTSNKTEVYYYSNGHLSYVTNDQNELEYYIVRSATGTPVSFIDYTGGTPENYIYSKNTHGDIVGLRDNQGNKVVSYSYDAYGNILESTGSEAMGSGELLKDVNPLRYAGYVFDEETDQYYLNARYYDSETGRFLNRDKLNSSNLYEYASSNPVSYIDPSGLWDAQNGGGQKRINIGDEHVYIKDETYEANPVDQESSPSTGNHQVSSGGTNTINEVKENITNTMIGSKADDIVKSVSNSFSNANQIGKHLVNQVGTNGLPGIGVGVGMDYVSNKGEGFDLTRSIMDGFLTAAAGAIIGGFFVGAFALTGPLAAVAFLGGGIAAGVGASYIKNSRNKKYLTPRRWGALVNSLWD